MKLILSFWIEPEKKKELEKMAKKKRITLGEFLRRICDEEINKKTN